MGIRFYSPTKSIFKHQLWLKALGEASVSGHSHREWAGWLAGWLQPGADIEETHSNKGLKRKLW